MTTAPQLTIEYRRLDRIVPADVNPKAHARDHIRASLERHGFVDPLIDDARTGKLIGGHGRTHVLLDMHTEGAPPPDRIGVDDDGMWLVPVTVGYSSTDDQDAAALLVGLNQTTTAGGWLDDQLAPLLDSLDNLAGTGFNQEQVDALLASVDTITVHEHERQRPGDNDARPFEPDEPAPRERPVTVDLRHGDCIEIMRAMPDASVDSIVCDPPYGLEFMGKAWDSFRVDDPGTERFRGDNAGDHGTTSGDSGTVDGAAGQVAYGGGKRPSTSRCTGCGKRDAFRNDHDCPNPDHARWATELIDPYAAPPTSLAFQNWCRTWGLEALRVLKPGGHVAAFGATRLYHRLAGGLEDAGFEIRDSLAWMYGSGFPKSLNLEGEWDGWGTALKPAFEPIVLARKPLAGSVAANVLEHGTGALNIDGCRIGTDGGGTVCSYWPEPCAGHDAAGGAYDSDHGAPPPGWPEVDAAGRWPANVVLDEEAAAILDEQSGSTRSTLTSTPGAIYGNGDGLPSHTGEYGFNDEGGASRFFYVAKASTAERNAGLDALEPRIVNFHPTVKPIALMRWLVRLVTPPGGIVLDPFAGSGSTLVAAVLEGFDSIGCEMTDDYLPIIEARTAWAHKQVETMFPVEHS